MSRIEYLNKTKEIEKKTKKAPEMFHVKQKMTCKTPF